MAQAGDTDEEAVDDKMEVENAIRKAMNVWMKDNPDDEDEDEEGGSFLTESKFPNGAPKRGRKPKPVPNPKLKYNYLTGELLCNLCNKTMGSKEALRHHLNVAHTGGNPLYCILCTKRFRFHSTFKQHMLMEHDIDESEDQTWERVVEGKGRKMNRGILEHDIEAPIEREEAQLLYEKPANSNPYRSVRQTGLGHLSNANEILRQVRKKEEDNRRSIKIMKLKRQAPDLEVDVVIEPQETITNPMTIIQGASPVKQQRFSPPSEGAFNNAIQDEYTFTFQCNLCTKSFVSKPELEDHLNDAHTSIFGNNFSCAICSRRFHIKSNYDIHMRLDHGLDSSGRSLQQPPILERQDVDASKPANASASTTFATPGSSTEVILTDSLHDAQLDGPIGESGQEITSEIAVEVPSEPIPVQQPSNLKTRPGETPTETAAHTSPTKTKASGTKQSAPQIRKCYHCDQVFQESWMFDSHLESAHTHRCKKCDRVFTQQDDLETHTEAAHSRKKVATPKKASPPTGRKARLEGKPKDTADDTNDTPNKENDTPKRGKRTSSQKQSPAPAAKKPKQEPKKKKAPSKTNDTSKSVSKAIPVAKEEKTVQKTEIKRGRGRPRKDATVIKETTNKEKTKKILLASKKNKSGPVKVVSTKAKPVGRPPKAASIKNVMSTQGRGRGRPPKSDANQGRGGGRPPKSDANQGRGRGRPPKSDANQGRGRGRPPKSDANQGRGRPPKSDAKSQKKTAIVVKKETEKKKLPPTKVLPKKQELCGKRDTRTKQKATISAKKLSVKAIAKQVPVPKRSARKAEPIKKPIVNKKPKEIRKEKKKVESRKEKKKMEFKKPAKKEKVIKENIKVRGSVKQVNQRQMKKEVKKKVTASQKKPVVKEPIQKRQVIREPIEKKTTVTKSEPASKKPVVKKKPAQIVKKKTMNNKKVPPKTPVVTESPRKSGRVPTPKKLPEGFIITGPESKLLKNFIQQEAATLKQTPVKKAKNKKETPVKALSKTTGRKAITKTSPKKSTTDNKKVKAISNKKTGHDKKEHPSKPQNMVTKKGVKRDAKNAVKIKSTKSPAKSKESSVKQTDDEAPPVKSLIPIKPAQKINGKDVYEYLSPEGTFPRSEVWRYFGFYKKGDNYNKENAVCLICGEEKPYISDKNTTNLRSHLQIKHNALYKMSFEPLPVKIVPAVNVNVEKKSGEADVFPSLSEADIFSSP